MKMPLNFVDILKRKHADMEELVKKVVDGKAEFKPLVLPEDEPEFNSYANNLFRDAAEETCDFLVAQGIDPQTVPHEELELLIKGRHNTEVREIFARASYTTYHNLLPYGCKTFFVTDGLAEHLSITDVNINCKDFKLPFPSCQFVFTLPLVALNMYRVQDKEPDPSLDYTIAITLSEVEAIGFEGQRSMQISAFAIAKKEFVGLYQRVIMLREDWDIERALRTDWAKLKTSKGIQAITTSEEEKIFFDKDGLDFLRVVLNAVIYLNSKSADIQNIPSPHNDFDRRIEGVQSAKKRKKLKDQKKSLTGSDYILIGESVPRLHISPDDETRSAKDSGRKINKITWVRGYYKTYTSERYVNVRGQTEWVGPYKKGPDIGEEISRPYVLK